LGLDVIGKNFLVPKHEIVRDENREELLAKFSSTMGNFPRILSDDPAVAEIGAKKDDLIKITRKSITAGTSIYYRVVV